VSDDSLEDFAASGELTKLLRAASRHKADAEISKNHVKELQASLDTLEQEFALLSRLKGGSVKPPAWLRPKRKGNDVGIVCAVLSDTHFDEVVNPDEIQGRNAYNRHIAVLRLQRFFEKTILLSKEYLTGLDYSGMVLFMGGDIFSGDIHHELTETNEDTMLGSVLFWVEQLSAGIGLLADEFDHVHIPCVVGNHGRRTRKPRAKLRARITLIGSLRKRLNPTGLTTSG